MQGRRAQGRHAPDPPYLVDAAEPEWPRRPLADSSADRDAGLCCYPLLGCWLQRGQPKVVAASVALAEATVVALSQIAHEACGDLLPLTVAVVPIGAARGSAGALPERHWAGAPPSAPPFARLSRRDFTPSRLFRRPCTDGYAGRSIHRDAAECFGSFVSFRVWSSVQPQKCAGHTFGSFKDLGRQTTSFKPRGTRRWQDT